MTYEWDDFTPGQATERGWTPAVVGFLPSLDLELELDDEARAALEVAREEIADALGLDLERALWDMTWPKLAADFEGEQ